MRGGVSFADAWPHAHISIIVFKKAGYAGLHRNELIAE
jgi:hypothetical protein